MSEGGEIWGLVLAAGDGRRVGAVTRDRDGNPAPKQYCALVDDRSLLRTALDRAGRLLPRRRIVVVVAESHRRFWERELADWPPENVIVQPENRGTAAGILLPLLAITGRDPEARVVLFPSDHHIDDETIFLRSLAEALSALERPLDRVILLGVTPDSADAEYGWIVPRQPSIGLQVPVERFLEKPDSGRVAELTEAGAAWNSFAMVARASTLLALYVRSAPELLDRMVDVVLPRRPVGDRVAALNDLYAGLETIDFSRRLLEGNEGVLLLQTIPPCGWTDLGTPDRLARLVRPATSRPERVARHRTGGWPEAFPALVPA